MNKVSDTNVLKFIQSFSEEHGYAPSYREIGSGIGLTSTSSVHARITKLCKKGLLESRQQCTARTIILTENALNLLNS